VVVVVVVNSVDLDVVLVLVVVVGVVAEQSLSFVVASRFEVDPIRYEKSTHPE
jgi:hypothetical protein